MVVKLEGKVDGQDIIFWKKEGDWWETTIPPSLNGIYIVELVATDEAGNQGFATKYILAIDFDSLCVHLKPLNFYAGLQMDAYDVGVKVSDYSGTVKDIGIYSELQVSNYYATLVEKSKCEERYYGNCS